MESSAYTLAHGKRLTCVVCGADQFTRHAWKLQTTGMSLFNLDWANNDATCLVCTTCHYIHWFNE